MKNILFLHQASTIGGGSYCLLNILKSLERENIEPVACLASDGPLKKEIERLGINVIIFPEMAAVPYNRTLWSFSSIRAYYRIRNSIDAFKKMLQENNIDVVYLNNMMIYPYLKPAKECGCKTILHCREHWPLNEHVIQLQWAQRAVYSYADELITINKYSASIFPQKKATIIYDWIDMDSRFEERPLDVIFGEDMSDKKVYLYTGGVQRIKGAVQVINSFSTVLKDPNVRLLAVGINTDYVENKLRQILAKIGVKGYYRQIIELIRKDKRIVCIPPTYMLSNIMQQCYCNLSYFTIPHANLALAECEIMGTPSIAADNEEAQEYSNKGTLSYLFEANSLASFHNAIRNFDAMYKELRVRLCSEQDELKVKFSKKENATKLNRIISKVL